MKKYQTFFALLIITIVSFGFIQNRNSLKRMNTMKLEKTTHVFVDQELLVESDFNNEQWY